MSERVLLSRIDLDMDTYPRKEWKPGIVQQYVDALRGGATLPPVSLERDTFKLLTGLHRIKAWEYLLEHPELWDGQKPDGYIEAEYLEVAPAVPRKLFRAGLDSTHGLRLLPEERKAVTREVFQANPDYKEKDCAALLGVSPSTISEWVKDILAHRREERLATAWKLCLLGWTQQDIGDRLGVAQNSISMDLSKTSELKKLIKEALASGLPVEEVSKRFNLPPLLVWQAQLEGKDDRERFRALGWDIRPWDYWSWGDVDHRFGQDWPGRIPAQLVAHTLYFFTHEGDMVLDPMAGGATVPDVCLAFGRRCRSYDMQGGGQDRPEVEQWLWQPKELGWPPSLHDKPGLLFWDPPYYRKLEGEYGQGCLSGLEREEYLLFFRDWSSLARKHSKPQARLALLAADWRDFQGKPALEEEPTGAVTLCDYIHAVASAGWKLTHMVYAPLSSQRFHAGMVEAMQKSRILGTTNRYLLVFRAT